MADSNYQSSFAKDITPEQQSQYPNLNPPSSVNGNTTAGSTANGAAGSLETAKNSVYGSMNTMSSIQNSETVKNLQNGPVADKARTEAAATQNDFSNLAASKQVPNTPAATGQPLTHYHSFFYSLLSWENPRATAISYVSIVLFIFATRYVPLVRYGLRLTWIVLGVTAAAEIAGKLVFDQGMTSKFRPKKYYTIPRETLESSLEDVEQLINFFVIEVQRILFAENVYKTIAAFVAALSTYLLIKITPAWGLALVFTTIAYFAPLAYIQNKELIDGHLNNASELIGQQSKQVRDLASQHTSKAMDVTSKTAKDYASKAQDMLHQTKATVVEKGYVKPETAEKILPAAAGGARNESAFPSAPRTEPVGPASTQAEAGKAEPIPSFAQ